MEKEIKRDYYLNQLIKRKNNGLIKIVTGIRRCGKSYLLRNIFKNYLIENGVDEDHIIEMSFDLYDNIEYKNKINDYFKKIVVTSDTPKPCYTEEGILMMNVYDFLLNPELIDL